MRIGCRAAGVAACAFLMLTIGATAGRAATLPSGFTEALVASGLNNPTAMQFAPDGRLFVCEQGGRLRVIKNGALLSTPFLTVTVSSSGERGLLGVAFDPNFAVNQYVYVYYTATSPAVHNRVSRFSASGDVAAAGSEVVLLDLNNLSSATNHNGGALNFGPDGKLYVSVGENANAANAQTLSNLLGKVLRLNADGTIPTDNPFYASATGQNRAIWALGLRNPFTFAFSPSGSSMFVNDVGQSTFEEINDGAPGANYGWPDTEGATTDPRFDSPRSSYAHSGGACAIVGGAFYSPATAQFPSDYLNDYFFADYCAGWIRRLDPANGNAVTTFATGITSPVDLKVSEDGSLYYLARGGTTGVVYRVSYGATAPTITSQPSSRSAAPGTSVTFSVRASGPVPLRYQWQRNGADISGATSQDYTLASVATVDNGARFRAIVSNDYGSTTSAEAVLTVTSNQAPTATIASPAAGTLYSGGVTINFSGAGSDPEDGTLAASAFTWRVDFHHDTHSHPFMAATSGMTSGTFTIPTTGETAAKVWYRVYLTVRDSAGATQTVQRDVLPRKVMLTLATSQQDFSSGWTASRPPLPHRSRPSSASSARSKLPARRRGRPRTSSCPGRTVAPPRTTSALRPRTPSTPQRSGRRRRAAAVCRPPISTTSTSPGRPSPASIPGSISHGGPARRQPPLTPTPSAHDGPERSKRRTRGPTPSTRSATMACGCG